MLELEASIRAELWRELIAAIEAYIAGADELRVFAELDPAEVRAFVERLDFARPLEPVDALRFAVEGLTRFQMHFRSPRYFGLFDPAPTTMGIAADALVAAVNPQLAAWIGSPFGIEAERYLVRAFGERFGYPAEADGIFTSGGAEANHTALATALTRAFPDLAERGLRALPGQPVFYVSEEGHPSLRKAARLTGLGDAASRQVPVDEGLRLDADLLAAEISRDRRDGLVPFMVVATAGTTGAGAVDPIAAIADVAVAEGLWLHADAAWGGGAALVPELRSLLAGIERADSITFDPHKLLSVPMGAGLYLTCHSDVLERTFHVGAPYLPATGELVNPYSRSMQWSRRFVGLKVLLSLAVAGWEGYAAVLRHQVAMGELLRAKLRQAGWQIVNESVLPLVCFVDPTSADPEVIVQAVNTSGRARIFTTTIPPGRQVIRACITNHRTQPEDLDALIESLEVARSSVSGQA
jgi:glutamate/tyrosine decarboxylase-like PLP-dependent enzyme